MSKAQIKQLSENAYTALCYNQFQIALDFYHAILTLDPNEDSALHSIAFILNLQGKHKTALDLAKKAITHYRCNAAYYTTLASIYRNLGNYQEAVSAIRTACELKPRDAMTLSNAAMILADERRYDRAKDVYEAALECEPDNAFVHFNYALLLLAMGDFKKGWREYEWRIPLHCDLPKPVYPQDLKGKKVRVIAEQGYGDFIMFSRYCKLLEKAGAIVYINCPRALEKLYDCHYCPDPDLSIRIMSLPSLFDEIPNEPYIKAPGKIQVPGDHMKIGVVARAVKSFDNNIQVIKRCDGSINVVQHPASLAYLSTFKRSLPHDFFDPIIDRRDIRLYNLQRDAEHYGTVEMKINDFGDLADLVDQMDLIITIDTAVAHLAGAMGKKTWLLLPYDAEWRWQADREDSPWYPSMRIFRQPKRGDWTSVQDFVIGALTERVTLRLGDKRDDSSKDSRYHYSNS